MLSIFIGEEVLSIFIGKQVLSIFTGKQVLSIFIGEQVLSLFIGKQVLNLSVGKKVLSISIGEQALSIFIWETSVGYIHWGTSVEYVHWETSVEYIHWVTGGWFNIKMPSYQYRKSHCDEKTVARSSFLHNGISYTDKVTFYNESGHKCCSQENVSFHFWWWLHFNCWNTCIPKFYYIYTYCSTLQRNWILMIRSLKRSENTS